MVLQEGTRKQVIRKTKAKRLLKLPKPATCEASDGNDKSWRSTVAAADAVFHSSRKTSNFCAISTVFIFTLMPLKQFLTFHVQQRENLLYPNPNVKKKTTQFLMI